MKRRYFLLFVLMLPFIFANSLFRMDMKFRMSSKSAGADNAHYLLIDGANHYLLIDNLTHKLQIDGAQ